MAFTFMHTEVADPRIKQFLQSLKAEQEFPEGVVGFTRQYRDTDGTVKEGVFAASMNKPKVPKCMIEENRKELQGPYAFVFVPMDPKKKLLPKK